MENEKGTYGFGCVVEVGFDEAVTRVRAALKSEGFGVLSEINVSKALHDKLGVDFRKYVILGACNPPLAHRALSTDLEVGLLLPCNVVVYENTPSSSSVRVMDPNAALGIVPGDALRPIAAEARERLLRVVVALRV